MKILLSYIKQYWLNALIFAVFAGVFAGVFSLYNLEVEAVIYASGLCLLLAAVIITVHFLRFRSKHKKLSYIRKNIALLSEQLPTPRSLAEKDYTGMICDLQKIRTDELTKISSQRSEAIDYFTAWVHQIKAPIATMRLILQGSDTSENKELLSELFRIEQYTEMVLSYFRLESTSNDFVFAECQLDSVIRRSIRKFAPQFVRKRISLKYDGTNEVVLTDEKWLSFILEQLLSNAIKYTDSGSVTIKLSDEKVLSVSDTGIGIASEDIPRIFEKGFTGYNGRSDKKSTGLGLYLCKKAAEKLSIDISVSSVEGKGSAFYLDLNTTDLQVE